MTIRIGEHGEAEPNPQGGYNVWFLDPVTGERDHWMDLYDTMEEAGAAVDAYFGKIATLTLGLMGASMNPKAKNDG